MDGYNKMLTGRIHKGSLVCDGARIPRRPCNCADGVWSGADSSPCRCSTDGGWVLEPCPCPAFLPGGSSACLCGVTDPSSFLAANRRVYFETSIREEHGAWRLITPFQSTPLAVFLPAQLVRLWMLVWAAEAWEASRDLPQVQDHRYHRAGPGVASRFSRQPLADRIVPNDPGGATESP